MHRRFAIAAILCAALTPTTFATNATWISPTSGNWNTPTNWSTNPAIPNAIDDSATLGPTTLSQTVTLNGNITLGNLTFDSPFAYILTASGTNTLTLQTSTAAAITVTSNLTTGNTLITAPLILASDTTITNNATTHSLTLSGKLSGAANLTFSGPAPIILNANNSLFTGNLILNAAKVTANVTNSLGGAGNITLNTGSLLAINAGSSKNYTLNGGTLEVLSLLATTLAGTTAISADSTIISAFHSVITLNAVSGSSNLTLSIANVTLAGNPSTTSYTGNILLTSSASANLTGSLPGATITLDPTTQFTIALPAGTDPTLNSVTPGSVISNNAEVGVSADIDFRSALSANSTLSGVLFNTSNATLAGTNSLDINTLPGATTLRIGGTGSLAATLDIRPDTTTHTLRFGLTNLPPNLTVNSILSDHDAAPTNVDINGGNTTLTANNTYSGTTTIANGTLTITNPNALGTSSGTDTDATTINAAGTLNLGNITLANEKITLNTGGTLTGNAAASSTYANPISINGGTLGSATFTGALSGAGNFSVNGATLAGAGNYTGNLTFAAGNSTLNSSTALSSSANNVLVSGTLTVNHDFLAPLKVTGGTLSLAANVTLSNSTLTITGGILSAANISATYADPIILSGPTTFTTGTFSGPISGTANLTLNGTAILNGNNTYTGITTIASGASVTVNSPAALGSTAAPTVVNSGQLTIAAASSEPVTVNGGLFTVTGPYAGTLSINGGLTTLAVPSSIPIAMTNGSLNINNPFSGTLNMSGGNATVSAAASGNIAVSGGTLNLSAPGSSPINATGGIVNFTYSNGIYTGPISLSNATLRSSGNPATSFTQQISVAGTTTIGGTSTTAMQIPALTGSGCLTVSAPINVTGPFNFSGLYVQNAAGTTNFSTVTSSGIISLTGSGTTIVSSSLQHTGALYVHAGNLIINGGNSHVPAVSIPGRAAIFVNGTATFDQLVIYADLTFANAGLFGNGTLHLPAQAIQIAGGVLDFTGSAPELLHIDKLSSSPAQVTAFPSNFNGPLNIYQGQFRIIATASGSSSPINLLGSDVSVEFFGDAPSTPNVNGIYPNPIHLNSFHDANGVGLYIGSSRSAVTLTGTIDLGASGNTFGQDDPNSLGLMTITGSISGGPLTINPMMNVTLSGPVNTFAGLNINGDAPSSIVYLQSVLTSNAPLNLGTRSRFIIDNAASASSDRIPDSAPVNMQTAWLTMTGKSGANITTSETLGPVSLDSGENIITVQGVSTGAGNSVNLALSSLSRSPGSTIDFEDAQLGNQTHFTLGAALDGPHLLINSQSSIAFLGGAYTSDLYQSSSYSPANFVKYATATGITPLVASDYFTGSEALWNPTVIPSIPDGSSITLSASRTVLALKFTPPPFPAAPTGGTLNLANNTLNISSGGCIVQNSSTITGGPGAHLTAGGSASNAELFFHSEIGGMTISVNIADNPGPDGLYDPVSSGPLDSDNGQVSVVFAGEGLFTVSGNNTYSGTTYINSQQLFNTQQGVAFTTAASLPAGPIVINGGSLILKNAFLANTGPVTLNLGNITGNGTLNASSYAIQSGNITVPIVGNGTLTKTSTGNLSLSNISAFSGAINLLGGNVTLGITSGNQVFPNPILLQNSTLTTTLFNTNITLTGPLTMGDNSTLSLPGTTHLILSPSTVSVGTNATIIAQGDWIVAGSNDPFTDSSNPTRHMNVTTTEYQSNTAGGFYLTAGNKNIANLISSTVSVAAGTSLTVGSIQASNNITLGGNLTLRATGTGPDETGALSIAGTSNAWIGSLDLTSRSLIIEPLAANKAAAISQLRNQINSGRHGGDWLGKGITSSTVAADPTHYGIALLDNAVLQLTSFAGGIGNVDENSLLISPELLGDTNADGHVDLTDLSTVLNHFGQTTQNWTDGNFDYAATIDLTDLSAVLNNFGMTNPSAFSLQPSTLSNAPEPASLSLLLPAAFFLLNRQKRTT